MKARRRCSCEEIFVTKGKRTVPSEIGIGQANNDIYLPNKSFAGSTIAGNYR
jgi:hypothetical protein